MSGLVWKGPSRNGRLGKGHYRHGSFVNGNQHEDCVPVDHLALVLDEHGDVHEHLVELLDALLQLDEHLMPASHRNQSKLIFFFFIQGGKKKMFSGRCGWLGGC